MNAILWNKMLEEGRKVMPAEKGLANSLTKEDLATVIGTMEFFGATTTWMKQTVFDLTVAQFRIFDWLAMCIMSRNNDNRKQNEEALKVLVHSFIKSEYIEKDFILDLQTTDYDIDKSYKTIDVEG